MITVNSTLSYERQTVPPIIPVVQGDTGRNISFKISDYEIPEGATATFYIQKPSGNAIYNTAEVILPNQILVPLDAQCLAEAGENFGQVRILLDDEVITSFDFILLVKVFHGIDAIESLTELNVFDQAVADAVNDIQTEAEQIAAEVIASIPEDYTELVDDVDDLKQDFNSITEKSKNILPYKSKTTTVNGVTVTYDDGELSLSGTATGSGGRLIAVIDSFVLGAGTYTFSRIPSDYPVAIFIESNSDIISQISGVGVNSHTFTISESKSVYVGINVESGVTYNVSYNIQLEVGDAFTGFLDPSWASAVDIIARENITRISEKSNNILPSGTHTATVMGVQALYNNGHLSLLGTATQSGGRLIQLIDPILLVAGTYTISRRPSAYPVALFVEKGGDILATVSGVGVDSASFTIEESTSVYIAVNVENAVSYDISYDVQLEAGSVMTDFHPPLWESAIDSVARENIVTVPLHILQTFENITCCGDSLTYSQVYTGASTSRQAHITYPEALEKITGTPVTAIASAGYSAINWWSAYENSIAEKTNQCAIIYLGTNGGFTETLATDAPENSDPSTWANTNTGCLAKIVNKFQTVGAKVILVKCYKTSGTGDSSITHTNALIEQIATRFKCGLSENKYLADYAYHYYPDLTGRNDVHYNDLGYSAFAGQLEDSIAHMDTDYMKYLIPA